MSGSQTPTSTSSSSSSSRSSYRRLGSDTTPSPSSGKKSPGFDPRALSTKLAIVEASRALVQASSMLSVAAQAVSKAAASLAAATGHDEDDFPLEADFEDNRDWAGSPDWSKSNYNLSSPSTPIVNDTNIFGEGYRLREVRTSDEDPADSSDRSECSSEVVLMPVYTDKTPGSPTQSTTSVEAQTLPPVIDTQELPAGPTGSRETISPRTVMDPFRPGMPDDSAMSTWWPLGDGSTKESGIGQDANKAPPNHQKSGPSKASTSNAFSGQPTTHIGWGPSVAAPTEAETLPGTTHIVLQRGFDLLPSLCRITERRAKTVCVNNYSGITATLNIAIMLRANITLQVIVSDSLKGDKLASAVGNFNSARSGILLWPGNKALPTILGLADSPNIQLIHLGEPTETHSGIICSQTTIVQAKSELTKQEIKKRNHTLDKLNNICNEEGPTSNLQPYRTWLRTRLAKDSYARAFYLDWIVQRRRQTPNQSIVEIVRLANQYAGEFLLRGNSQKYGNPIGRQPTVLKSSVKPNKFEPAVQAGLLLVSR
ncbi:unnamed protein product [Rhizoctonia solani]|uniref:Uncharacterized protein n=1 Tax=Rhizoctonia solani TaxID=456999 RepID=A0A8H3I2Q8_9AGAM|nr:unnamed protein product [Rhizoctonia solani]